MRHDHGLCHWFDQAIVTVQPAKTSVIYIRYIVAIAGMFAIMVDDL